VIETDNESLLKSCCCCHCRLLVYSRRIVTVLCWNRHNQLGLTVAVYTSSTACMHANCMLTVNEKKTVRLADLNFYTGLLHACIFSAPLRCKTERVNTATTPILLNSIATNEWRRSFTTGCILHNILQYITKRRY